MISREEADRLTAEKFVRLKDRVEDDLDRLIGQRSSPAEIVALFVCEPDLDDVVLAYRLTRPYAAAGWYVQISSESFDGDRGCLILLSSSCPTDD